MNTVRRGMMALSCAGFALSANAQPTSYQSVSRPKFSQRMVAGFDFEEFDSPAPIPVGWLRGQHDPKVPRIRPGFPIWNLATLDTTRAHSGQYSAYLPTRGGSTSLVLRQGALPVLPGADYRVAAWVHTEGLLHARAAIEVTLLDDRGEPIEGQKFRSEVIRSEQGWSLLDVDVLNANAAFLQVDLLLLQPAEYLGTARRFDELITIEDVSGGAWFDDITIAQLPQIRIGLNSPGNIVDADEQPEVSVFARDLTGEDLTVRVRVLDIDGRIVDEAEFPFRGGKMTRAWKPELDALGWFRAIVEISDGVRVVGADSSDFAWVLADETQPSVSADRTASGPTRAGGGIDRPRFGIIVEEHDPAFLTALPDVAAKMGVGSVSLPAWWNTTEADGSEAVDLLLPIVKELRGNWQQVTLVLDRVPGSLAEQLGLSEEDILGMLEAPEEHWAPTVLPLLDRLGQMVQRWQPGRVSSERLLLDPNAADRIALLESALHRLVPEAVLAMPWPMDTAPTTGLFEPVDRSLILDTPGDWSASSIADAGPIWTADSPGEQTVQIALRCQDAAKFGYRSVAEDFARKAVEAWAAFGPRHDSLPDRGGSIAVVNPWVWIPGDGGDLRVRPEAAVMRNLVARLADRAGSAELNLAPGVRAVLLEPRVDAAETRGAALVVWAAPSASIPTNLEVLLAQEPVAVFDVFGNDHAVDVTRSDTLDLPYHSIPIGSSPVFVEGVDAELIRFLTQLAVDPPLLESHGGEHEHELVVTNPWKVPISGEIYIVEPGGFSSPDGQIDRSWRITPRVMPFLIESGQTHRFPVNIMFSPFEESGMKDFVMDIELSAAEEYGLLRVKRPLFLGSQHLRLDVSYRLGPDSGGPNVYVDADIVNVGDDPLTCRVSVYASGFRDTASVTALAPGQSARRSFVLANGILTLAGSPVSVSVEVPDLRVRLNRTVTID